MSAALGRHPMPAPAFLRRFHGGAAMAAARAGILALAEAERLRLALWLPVAFAGGIALYFALDTEPPAAWRWWAAPPVLLALALLPRFPLAAWLAGLPAAVALGAALASWQAGRQPPMPELPRGAAVLSGTVLRVDLLPEDGRRLTLGAPSLDGGPALERHLRLRLRDEDPARPAPGDQVRVRALIRPPAAPAWPGGWDFQRAAWFSGLGGSGFAIGRAEVTRAPGESAAPPLSGLRATIEERVAAALPGPTGAIAAALLAGGQSAIPPADMGAMRDSGLAHILSVSGLHVAIVMGLAFAVVRALLALVPPLALRWPVKALAALAALAAGAFYMVLTGSQVPMQRSLAMAALATLALLAGRRALTLRAWALAFLGVLAIDPSSLMGPSFQMSFAAVLALVAGWEALRPRIAAIPAERHWRRRAIGWAFGLVGTSLLAGAATTPFGLHHFGRIQAYGVVANALAVPVTSVLVMPAGMAAALLMPLGLEGWALAPMGWGIEAILWIAREVAAWPGAALAVPPIPAWGLGLAALGMLWLCLWRTRWRWLGVPAIAVGMLSGQVARPPDLLVSADARLIALRVAEGTVLVQRQSGASALTRDSWLRLWGETAPMRPFPQGAGTEAGGAIACTRGACRLRPTGGSEVVLLRGDPPAEACATAALVVSTEPVRGRCAARVVDRFAVWRHGPHAIWLDRGAGLRVVSDRAWRGARPWVPPEPVPRAAAAREPPALTE